MENTYPQRVVTDRIGRAIDKGVAYLHQHQFPNGEFASYVAADLPMQGWTRPDSTVFTTALVCHCLRFVKGQLPEKMQDLAMRFLGGQMNHGGVWNHFTRYHQYRHLCPLDVDDTSCVSSLYRDRGIRWPQPSNIPLLLANRNRDGLFYSWFLLRFRLVKNKTYWRITLPELLRPVKSLLFWTHVEANRNDVDGVVNANALYYLGDIPETQPVIAFLIKIIAEHREGTCDLWYRDVFFVYYFFTRNYHAGITGLQPIVQPIIHRILSQANRDGSIGKTVLDTAWAVCCLLNCRHPCPELDHAVRYLIAAQEPAGHWPRWLAYWGGPKLLLGWGSEELTTAFCLEAISRYEEVCNNPV